MSPMILFLISLGVFLCLSALSYAQIRRSYRRVVNEWRTRHAICERHLKAAEQQLKDVTAETASLKVDLEAERTRAQHLDSLLTRLYPSSLSSFDVLRGWKAVDAATLEKVRQEAVRRGEGTEPDEVLVKERIVSQEQLDDARNLAAEVLKVRSRW